MPGRFHCNCFFQATLLRPRHSPARVWAFSLPKRWLADNRQKLNHYEILGVPISATTSEIKKYIRSSQLFSQYTSTDLHIRKFYSLSKEHHPDKNPRDPDAHSRFSAISSSYAILSDESARARYDRDNNLHRRIPTSPPGQKPASYVGSRPASGLSKRRAVFRGPPQSFYDQGGYGNTQARRAQAQEQADFKRRAEPRSSESDPESFIHYNSVPHFDASSHHRTQMRQDERRRQRRVKSMEEGEKRRRDVSDSGVGGNSAVNFLFVSGILGIGIFAGVMSRSSQNTSRIRNEGKKNLP